ncbi:hypothetical protein K474DRAFT_1565817, partial [Panus rudis PR-1116 ss-1]
LKPEKPTIYSGSQDARAFHTFVRQCNDYVGPNGYNVTREMQVSVVSNFLSGKANDFFITCVSSSPRRWSLRRFFMELFNWCFPVDFRLQMQERLLACSQRNRTVREYVHDLEGLYLICGNTISAQEKVSKLWHGFVPYLQKELWKKELSPIHSTWRQV